MNEENMRIKMDQGIEDNIFLSYDDSCVHPGSTRNVIVYLRRYCNQMVRIQRNAALIKVLFSGSISSKDLDWFTSQELKKWSGWKALARLSKWVCLQFRNSLYLKFIRKDYEEER